jgi:hypothetical protein
MRTGSRSRRGAVAPGLVSRPVTAEEQAELQRRRETEQGVLDAATKRSEPIPERGPSMRLASTLVGR